MLWKLLAEFNHIVTDPTESHGWSSPALLLWLLCSVLDTPGGVKFVLLLANRLLFRGLWDGHNMDTNLTVCIPYPAAGFFI